jgi:hypothetical protein
VAAAPWEGRGGAGQTRHRRVEERRGGGEAGAAVGDEGREVVKGWVSE